MCGPHGYDFTKLDLLEFDEAFGSFFFFFSLQYRVVGGAKVAEAIIQVLYSLPISRQ